MQRQDQRRVLGDPQRLGRDRQRPAPAPASISASSASGSTTTPLPMMPSLPRTTPGRQQRQLVGLVADDQRMAGVVAALEPHHDIGAAGQPVHHLALALVAPLGADHRDIRHASVSEWSVGRGGCRRAGYASTEPPGFGRGVAVRAPARRRWHSPAGASRAALVLARRPAGTYSRGRGVARRRRAQHRVGKQRQAGGRLRLAADIASAAAQFLVPAGRDRS